MNPDDIPASVTELCKTGPWIIPKSPSQAAFLLAHFWPAIEAHIREQVAREIENDLTAAPWHLPPKPRIGAGDQWIDSRDCTKAAAIARNGATS